MLQYKLNFCYTRVLTLNMLANLTILFGVSTFMYFLTQKLPYDKLILYENMDLWFGTDIYRVVITETEFNNVAHHRNSVHPLYSLVTFPINSAISFLFNISKIEAVKIFHSFVAGLFILLAFNLNKKISNTSLAGFFIALLATFSSAFIFLAIIPETFILGATTICLALLFVLYGHPKSIGGAVWLGLLSFSITITNYGISLIASFFRLKPKFFIASIVASLTIATSLVFIQTLIFPKSGTFYSILYKEAGYVQLTKRSPEQVIDKIATRAVDFIFSGLILSRISIEPSIKNDLIPKINYISIKHEIPTLSGFIALIGWTILIANGVNNAVKNFFSSPVLAVALLFYVYQFILHLLYGNETFIYTLHSLPALLAIISCGFTYKNRYILIFITGCTLLFTMIVNFQSLYFIIDTLSSR